MNESEKDPEGLTAGVVTGGGRGRYVWAWIFPFLAAFAAGWLFWTNWKSQGPEIEITFDQAPGISAGKTPLIYRGIEAGRVTRVHLDPDLQGVRVGVRLKAFAAELARSPSEFWIERPGITLRGAIGIEALIQGNWIQARTAPGGAPRTLFVGLDDVPLDPLEEPSLAFSLLAPSAPFLDRGTPVFRRGTRVGIVRRKDLDASGNARLHVVVDKDRAELVRSTSRFWVLPAADLKISAHGADIQLPGIDALVSGGITFDEFGPPGTPTAPGASFALFSTEAAARANGPPLTIHFADARGIVPGQTEITLLGQAVGLVEDIHLDAAGGRAAVTIRLQEPYAGLARAGTQFTLVRPNFTIGQVSGLETLITGPYIAMQPAGAEGGPVPVFAGRTSGETQFDATGPTSGSLAITLRAAHADGLEAGSPVFFRGLPAGSVVTSELDPERQPALKIRIAEPFAAAVRENSRFWIVPPLAASVGPGTVDVRATGLKALIAGAIAFDTFEEPAPPAGPDTTFSLLRSEAQAAATSPPFRIVFPHARGLEAGKSQLRYLGVPVGVVDSLAPQRGGKVEVTARLRPGFTFLRTDGARFVLIKPEISLQALSGIETLISGIYIDCLPGGGRTPRDVFQGVETYSPAALEADTFSVTLTTKETHVTPGAPILYHDFKIGEILSKELTPDGSATRLTAGIAPEHRALVRTNSRFIDASGSEARIGFIKIEIPKESLIDPNGRITLLNPDKPGAPARAGQVFSLEKKK